MDQNPQRKLKEKHLNRPQLYEVVAFRFLCRNKKTVTNRVFDSFQNDCGDKIGGYSPYCIEELGIGWYRSQKKEADCFYLLIPDISYSEIGGFVNSKIDKFTVIDDDHKDDFGLLLENICEKLELAMPKHSAFLNIEKVFFDAVHIPIDEICSIREQGRQLKAEKEETEA